MNFLSKLLHSLLNRVYLYKGYKCSQIRPFVDTIEFIEYLSNKKNHTLYTLFAFLLHYKINLIITHFYIIDVGKVNFNEVIQLVFAIYWKQKDHRYFFMIILSINVSYTNCILKSQNYQGCSENSRVIKLFVTQSLEMISK